MDGTEVLCRYGQVGENARRNRRRSTAVSGSQRTYLLAAVATCQLPLGENGCALQNAEIAEPRRG